MNETTIITKAKGFVGAVREALGMVGDDNLFTVAISSKGAEALTITATKFVEVSVGTLAKERFPELYKKADALLKYVRSKYSSPVNGVFILITDEYETNLSMHGKVLRISNLDA